MASKTYSENVIVLRKTRLRESDLILTMLAEDGRQVRAVAKGALKPTGSFASRLELYSQASVLLVEGRSLDIVKEARLVDAHAPLRFDYVRSVCAAPVAELLAIATQDELPVPRLFPMTQAALACLANAPESIARIVMAAFLLKAASVLGFRPSFTICAECGAQVALGETGPSWFSHAAGGVLCADCAAYSEARTYPATTLAWANALMHSTFAQIAEFEADETTTRAVLVLVQAWIETHIGSLRSLPFVLQLS